MAGLPYAAPTYNTGPITVDPSLLPSLARYTAAQATPAAATGSIQGDVNAVASGLVSAYGGLRYGLPMAIGQARGTSTPEDIAGYQAGLQSTAAQAERLLPGGAPSFGDLTSGKVGFWKFLRQNIEQGAPVLGAGLAGAAAGGAVGTAVGGPLAGAAGAYLGSTAAMTPLFAGQSVQRTTNQGQTALPEGAGVRSLMAAPVEAAINTLTERFIPFGTLSAKIGAGKGLIGGAVEGALAAGGSQAIAAPLTQVGERYAAGQPLTDEEAGKEYLNSAATGLVVGGAMGMFGGLRGKAHTEEPGKVSNDDLVQAVDQATVPQSAEPGLPFQGPTGPEAASRAVGPGMPDRDEAGGRIASVDGQLNLPLPTQESVLAERRAQATVDLLKDHSDEQLQATLADLDTQQQAGAAVDPGLVGALQTELARRQALAEQVPPGPLFEDHAATAAANEARFAELTDGVQKSTSFLKGLQPADEATLAQQVHDQLLERDKQGKDWPKNERMLGERLGVVDDKGQLVAPQVPPVEAAAPAPVEAPVAKPELAPGEVQDVLPLQSGLPDRFFKPDEAPTGPMADSLQGLRDRMAAEQEASKATANRADEAAKAADALRDQQYTEALRARQTEASPDVDPRAAWMLQKPGDVMGWADLSDTAKQQWSDVLAQAPGKDDTGALRREISKSNGEATGTDYPPSLTEPSTERTVTNVLPEAAPETAQARAKLGVNLPTSELTPRQLEYQRVSNEIDQRFPNSSTIDPTGAATAGKLKAMIGQGADPAAIRAAMDEARYAPRVTPVEDKAPFVGEKPQRSVLKPVKSDPVMEAVKTNGKAAIDAAVAAGTMDRPTQLRALGALREGRLADVVAVLKNPQAKLTRGDFLSGVATEAAAKAQAEPLETKLATPPAAPKAMAQQLATGKVEGVLRQVASNSTNPEYRRIAAKLLAAGGWDKVSLHLGDALPDRQGETSLMPDASSRIDLYGEGGRSEETILHEMFHAFVQQRWGSLDHYTDENKALVGDTTDRGDTAVKEFVGMWQGLGKLLEKTNPDMVDKEGWASWASATPDEALSWVMTNPDAQAFLRTVDMDGNPVTTKPSMWQNVVGFFAKLLGLRSDPKTASALDAIMSAGHNVLDAGADVKTSDFTTKLVNQMATERGDALLTMQKRSVADVNEIPKVFGEAATKAKEIFDSRSDLSEAARKAKLGTMDMFNLTEQYDPLFRPADGSTPLTDVTKHLDATTTVRSRMAQISGGAFDGVLKVESAAPRAYEMIKKMAQYAINGIDGLKSELQHFGMEEDKVAGTPEVKGFLKDTPANRKLVQDANQLAINLQRSGHMQAYRDLIASNEVHKLAEMSMVMHNLISRDPVLKAAIPGFDVSPMDTFIANSGLHDNVQAAKDHFQQATTAQAQAVSAYVDKTEQAQRAAQASFSPLPAEMSATEKKTYNALSKDDKAAYKQQAQDQRAAYEEIRTRIAPVREQVGSMIGDLKNMSQVPYFHAPRFGDHFAAFKLLTGEDGEINQGAVDQVAKALTAAGFGDVVITGEISNPNVYIRLDKPEQARNLGDLAKGLQDKGLLDPKEIKSGPRTVEDEADTTGRSRVWLDSYLQQIAAAPGLRPEDKASMVSKAREIWLSMLPDSANARVMAQRSGVQGFSDDIMRGFALRSEIAANTIAHLSTAGKLTDAMIGIRKVAAAALEVGSPQHADVTKLNSVASEVATRLSQQGVKQPAGVMEALRSVSFANYLAASPSFVAMQLIQVGQLAWPELSKKGGYVASAKALAAATPKAFAVMRAVAQEGYDIGGHRVADVVISQKALERSKISPGEAEFLMNLANSGVLDIGGAARAQGRAAAGQVGTLGSNAMRYASSFGAYSEAFVRVMTALAAREMHGDKPGAVDYARGIIKNSMLTYDPSNTARYLGTHGVVGKATPFFGQFMNFQAQVTAKLYREVHTAFMDNARTEAEKTEAKRFLMGHLGATIAVAGTLGLPFASVISTAAGKLVDLFSDKDDLPFDATAAFRGYLSDIFGKEASEVMSKGLPTLGGHGVDISQRVGEQDWLPFSKLWTDRRKWEDVVKDQALSDAGAPLNMVSNIIKGGRDVLRGDVLKGMIEMAPAAIRGPAKAYQMSDEGYIDSKGNKLPMTPEGQEILGQALGFTPAKLQQYRDAQTDQTMRQQQAQTIGGNIKNNLVEAIQQGDKSAMSRWMSKAIGFDKANPAYGVLPSLGATLSQDAQQRGMANALGMPTGMKLKDTGAQAVTRYGNWQDVK